MAKKTKDNSSSKGLIIFTAVAILATIFTVTAVNNSNGGNGEIITPSEEISENINLSENVSEEVVSSEDISLEENTSDVIISENSSIEVLEKITPEITFNNLAGGSFYSTDLDWMHNVPSDAEYVVTYDCGEGGIVGADAPENNGKGWSQIITILENDKYNATSNYSPWFYYLGQSNVEIRGFTDEEYGASVADSSSRDYAMDGNLETYLWVKTPKSENAYIEFTLDELSPKSWIYVDFGNDDGGDLFNCTISVSADKETYYEAEHLSYSNNTYSDCYKLDNYTPDYKYIRFTNNGSESWITIREILLGSSSPLN